MKMSIADPDLSTVKQKRRQGEATRCEKINLSGQKEVGLRPVNHRELAQQEVLVSETGEPDAVRQCAPESADHSIVVPLTELTRQPIAETEHAVEDFLETDYVVVVAVLIEPLGDVVGVRFGVVQELDAFSFFHRDLREQIRQLWTLTAMRVDADAAQRRLRLCIQRFENLEALDFREYFSGFCQHLRLPNSVWN